MGSTSLFYFIIFISSISYSQNFGATKIIEDTKFGSYLRLMGTSETQIAYLFRNPDKSSSKHQYHVIDTKNNSAVEMTHSGMTDGDLKGFSMSGIIHGNYLYEVLRFKGKSLEKGTAKIGVVKRKLSDLSQVGEISYCGMVDITEYYGMVRFMNVNLYESENGFHVICDNSWGEAVPTHDPFIAYLDYDCNVKWTSDLPFLRDDNVTVLDVISDSQNGLTMPLHVKNVIEKGGMFKEREVERGMVIMRFDENGENETFNPELPGNMKIFSNQIKYIPSTKQYVGVFYTSGKSEAEPDKAISQVEFLKWNNKGDLIFNSKTPLKFSDFDTKAFEQDAKKAKFDMGDIITSDGYITSLGISGGSYQIIINEDGSCFVGTEEFKNAKTYLLTNSGLMMAFDKEGNMVWGKLYSGNGGAAVQVFDKVSGSDETILKYSVVKDELYMYRRKYYDKNVGDIKAGKYLEQLVFDFESGEQLSNDLVHQFDDKLKYSREETDENSIQRREAIRFFNVTGKKNSFIIIN